MADPRQERPQSGSDEPIDETVDEAVDEAMAVDSLPDEVRTHGDSDETDRVQRNAGPPEPAPDDTASSEE